MPGRACYGETMVFRGIMLGQNIEAAHTVIQARNGDLIEAGAIADGAFSLGDMAYRGKHFTMDQTNGVVVADDLDRVQIIVCNSALLEKMAGFAFADARMAAEWMVAELKLPGMDVVQAGRPTMDPYSYEYRSSLTRPPYVLRVLSDKTLVIQSLSPNRRKSNATNKQGESDEI